MDKSLNVAELFGLSKYPGSETQAIKQEMYDADLYQDMLDFSPTLQDIVARGENFLATFNYLTQDIFLALFKLNPELNSDENIKPECLPNKQILVNIMENDDFQRLRSMTRLDSVGSGLGTQVLAEKLLEEIEQLNNGDNNDNQPDTGAANVAAENIAISKDKLSDACKSAMAEVEETINMGKTWGIEPGDVNARISYHSKKRALERLRSSPKLKQLTELVGRLRRVAINGLQKFTGDISSIKDVSTGNNLERILPSEKMLLANNVTRKDFHRRYYQRELLQYRTDGTTPRGRGPMVVCCDVSGSMRGKPEEWSKAMVIALAEVAQREKRDFACILFNSQVVGTWIIPRGIWDPSALIDVAEMFPCGGTAFDLPIEKSLEFINTSRFKHADVVFITDGKCELSSELLDKVNQTKARKEFAIITVLIDIDGKDIKTVQEFSDEVILISSLADLNDYTAEKLISTL